MSIILNPSILAANFVNLEKDIRIIEKHNLKSIHIDIMDGNFVPNITFGYSQVEQLRKITDLYFDVHLMVNEPIRFIDDFKKAGANCITIHAEACTHLHRTIEYIKSNSLDCGVALNPATSLESLDYVINIIDKVLIMTVNPGFGGQKFIENSIRKIENLKLKLESMKMNTVIQVDGGINEDNIQKIISLGVTDVVAGSSLFNKSLEDNIVKFLNLIDN